MTPVAPIDFQAALDKLGAKKNLPTSLGSYDLQMHSSADLLERSFFSARVLDAQVLQEFRNSVDAIMRSTSDRATQRLRLKQLLASIDYRPEAGKEGTLEDLSSNARLNVMLDTNASLLRGYGQWKEGNTQGALLAFPAQELVRVAYRKVPRHWRERWNTARAGLGDATTATNANSGRLVALKNDPIWAAISRFGLPYPPFDYRSGMGVEDVSYEDAVSLGVMSAEDGPLAPPQLGMNSRLQSSLEGLDDDLARALATGLSDLVEMVGDALVFKNDQEDLRGRTDMVLAALANAYDPSQPRDAHGRWIAEAWDRALVASQPETRAAVYKPVEPEEAARIKAATGLDVAGYSHSVAESDLRHAFKEHGDPAKEARRGQAAITRDDIEKIPHTLRTADSIRLDRTPQGYPALIYTKKAPDGTTTVIEEVRTGRRQLAFRSIRKIKGRATSSGFDSPLNNARSVSRDPLKITRRPALRQRANAALRALEAALN